MKDDMLVVMAFLQARPGRGKDLKAMLERLVRDCAGHEGLLLYSVHEDKQDPDAFVFYEQFTSEQALKVHGESPELRRFREESKDLLAQETQIRLLKLLAKVDKR